MDELYHIVKIAKVKRGAIEHPPKEWRPACYSYNQIRKGCGCKRHHIDETEKADECLECPYRKME